MSKQRCTTVGIVPKLREADLLTGQGQTVAQATKQVGLTDKTHFRCCRSHGGLRVDQAKRPRDLEAEKARLKKAVAELTIGKIILQEAAEGTAEPNASAGSCCPGLHEAPVLGATDLPCLEHRALDAALCAADEGRRDAAAGTLHQIGVAGTTYNVGEVIGEIRPPAEPAAFDQATPCGPAEPFST